jgi:hypothetical protein
MLTALREFVFGATPERTVEATAEGSGEQFGLLMQGQAEVGDANRNGTLAVAALEVATRATMTSQSAIAAGASLPVVDDSPVVSTEEPLPGAVGSGPGLLPVLDAAGYPGQTTVNLGVALMSATTAPPASDEPLTFVRSVAISTSGVSVVAAVDNGALPTVALANDVSIDVSDVPLAEGSEDRPTSISAVVTDRHEPTVSVTSGVTGFTSGAMSTQPAPAPLVDKSLQETIVVPTPESRVSGGSTGIAAVERELPVRVAGSVGVLAVDAQKSDTRRVAPSLPPTEAPQPRSAGPRDSATDVAVARPVEEVPRIVTPSRASEVVSEPSPSVKPMVSPLNAAAPAIPAERQRTLTEQVAEHRAERSAEHGAERPRVMLTAEEGSIRKSSFAPVAQPVSPAAVPGAMASASNSGVDAPSVLSATVSRSTLSDSSGAGRPTVDNAVQPAVQPASGRVTERTPEPPAMTRNAQANSLIAAARSSTAGKLNEPGTVLDVLGTESGATFGHIGATSGALEIPVLPSGVTISTSSPVNPVASASTPFREVEVQSPNPSRNAADGAGTGKNFQRSSVGKDTVVQQPVMAGAAGSRPDVVTLIADSRILVRNPGADPDPATFAAVGRLLDGEVRGERTKPVSSRTAFDLGIKPIASQPRPSTDIGSAVTLPVMELVPNPRLESPSGSAVSYVAAEPKDARAPELEEWQSEIGAKVLSMVDQGEQSVVINLSPVELGPLQIDVTVREGEVSVAFAAHVEETRVALEASMPKLRELLAGEGLSLTNSFINNGLAEFSSSYNSRNPQRSQEDRPSYRPRFVETDTSVHGQSAPSRRRQSLVDLYA